MKKRVLMVSCEGLGNGGVQAIMMGIVRNLYTECHFDMLLFTSEKRYYDDEFLKYGGKIFRVPKYEGGNCLLHRADYYVRDFYTYREVNKILKNEPPYDVIHCNREYENAPLLMLASKYNVSVRISQAHIIHGKTNVICTLLNKFRTRLIRTYATKLIGCSYEACCSLYSERAIFTVLNNFYDDNRFDIGLFTPANISGLTIVQVGAISDIKNQIYSVEVLAYIRSVGIPARLKIIGFDMNVSYRKLLEEKIESIGLREYVDFLPGNTNIPLELNKSNCFIMPSLHEGFGIAIIEAQSMSLKCFASTNIPLTTNCGNVTYLKLTDGPAKWGDAISQWYQKTKGEKKACDTEKFKCSYVINKIRELYKIVRNENTCSW